MQKNSQNNGTQKPLTAPDPRSKIDLSQLPASGHYILGCGLEQTVSTTKNAEKPSFVDPDSIWQTASRFCDITNA